jgi:hypothetical protein
MLKKILLITFLTYSGLSIATAINLLFLKDLPLEETKTSHHESSPLKFNLSIINSKIPKSSLSTSRTTEWNSSEIAILNFRNKLESIQNKFNLSGEWGKINLKINMDKGVTPSGANLDYLIGF